MSCNGCRVLRKGCSDTCVLRPCIQWIDGADAQAHATVFVAKFFGRSTLLSFLSSVPLPHRPAAFRSLLYDACGRTINPVNGATGLLWTGNWRLCQAAVEAVLAGGTLRPLSDLGSPAQMEELYMYQRMEVSSQPRKRKRNWAEERSPPASDLGLGLTRSSPREDMWRGASPSATSESSTTTNVGGGGDRSSAEQPALLNLFV